MRSVSLRVVVVLLATFVTATAFAHDVTLSGTTTFAAIDGSSSDHDGAANGVFTVNDGNLIVNGVVNCNDDSTTSACAMAFSVSGNMTVNTAGALYAENRSGGGNGGAITLTVGGNLTMNGNAIVSSASKTSSGAPGGNITATVSGNVVVGTGSTIDSGSANAAGGNINVASAGLISVDGNVLSGPSRTILSTRLTGVALDGGTANQIGGQITIATTTFVEPAIVIGGNANIISQGDNNGAGPVTIDGCGVQVRGLVAALSRKDSAAKVRIRSGKDILVDGRDLGVSGAPLGRNGRLRADAPSGTALNKGVDVFASETIDIYGPASGSLFAITALPGLHDSKSYGGLIRIIAIGDAVTASGNVIDDGHSASGDTGGTVDIAAKEDVNLNTAVIRAVGDFNTNNSNRGGGTIHVRSYSGDVVWTNGTGEVRPVGSASNLPLADQGSIVLTACGTINTTGSTFPVMGTATSPLPETHTGVCSPAAPSLPAGVAALVTCNTPPVANDTAASTNEDTSVTVTMTGTDADGDTLTFTVVSGPANGSVGAVTFVNATTSTVVYTPNLNFNGIDSFDFQANDGNGGTDIGTATITVAPVNDPPTFLIGPTVTVLEDAGPQTYTNWVTAISPGPADESGQTVTFSVTNNNNALFSVQPAVSSNGTLTYTPAANAYGSATITVTAQDNGGIALGGNDTSAPQNSSITVTPVNDEPSFTAGASQTVNEDAGPQSVSGWATGISAGPNEGSQTVSFVLTNNNNALFSSQPAVSSSGTLTYTPAANANGSATVTIYAQDDGGNANGGDDTSPSQTFTITVNAVNDAPSFTSGGDVSVLEDSGAYSAAWATAISAGPADESGQTVTFNTSNDNNALFSVQPSISSTGVLSFTLGANTYGTATVTVTLSDNGGILNGGVDTSAAQTFTITVGAVNDEPTFTAGGDVTVNEDSGAYSAAWASAISAGPNESGQTLTFNVSNDNNALFSSQPSISATGVLSFTPASDAFGTATVTVYLKDDGGIANGGDDTSPTVTFTITVNSVNDAPSFTGGGNVTVDEDSGAYSAVWATAISAGPANESSQTVTFNVSNNNNALFSVQPSVSSSGVLSFTLNGNATGSATVTIYAQDDGGIANGGVDVSASQTFTISVNSINDPPTFTPGADQTSNEDAGPQTVVGWATAISPGPANESGQTVTFVTSNNNNALFSAQPTVSSTGTLTYTAAPNANGTATVSIYAQDNGGGTDTSATYMFTITIVAVNDAPSFTSGGNVSVLEDSGAYSAAWATAISAGPADESGQTLTFNITGNSNPSLFASGPSISPSGVLSFTLNANAFGSSNITVTLSDNGGGANTSAPQSFTITVQPVNDAPSFVGGGDVTVNEDSGPYAAGWATSISAGPANESGQTLTFNVSNNNNALFLVQPSINSSGLLTFTTALNANGSATVTVTLSDNGGIANGGVDTSAAQTFVINVTAANDGPTAVNDSWQTLGNTELRVDLPAGLTPSVNDTTPSGNGVRDNDSDPEGDPTVVTGIVGCGDVTAPFDCTLGDGSKVSMLANGSFSYKPAPGATSGTFQYTMHDLPGLTTSTGTVTISILDMIWYVNGAAAPGGNGTSSAPFTNFTSLNGGGDVDGVGNTIFVHTSAVVGSIALEASQLLWGEGVGLSKPYNLNGNGSPTVLVAAGVNPTVTSAADVVTILGVMGTEVAGLNLVSTTGTGIDITAMPLGTPAGVNAYSNVITAATDGIDVNGGSAGGSVVTISNTTITSGANGIDVSSAGTTSVGVSNVNVTSTGASGIVMNAAGSLTVTALSNINVSGTTAVDGIRINNAAFSSVATGTVTVGSSGNPVGAEGVVVTNSSGSLAFGTLTVFGGTTGVTISGAGAGLTVTSGGGSISAPSGVGLSVTNATIGAANLSFTTINSTGGANGIVLTNTGTQGGLKVIGSGSAGSGGTISGKSSHGVSLSNTERLGLAYMNISSNAGHGIGGNAVKGFVLDNVSLSGNGTSLATDDSGINITNLTGTLSAGTHPTSIANSTISNNREFEVVIANTTGTLADFRITGSSISSNGVPAGHGNLVSLLGSGTASMTLTVVGGSYTGAAPNTATGIHADTSGGSMSANVSGASFTNNNVGVSVSASASGNLTFDLDGNTLNGSRSSALNLFLSLNHTGTSSGKFRNNIIGTFGTAGSGSVTGSGVTVSNEALSNTAVLINNNDISQMTQAGVTVIGGVAGSPLTGTTAVTVTNNLIRNITGNRAIVVTQGVGKGTICADISNNSMSGIAGSAGNGQKIRIAQFAGGTFKVRQKQATAAVDPLELDDANSVGANITTPAQVSAGGTITYNAGVCAQP